MAYTVSFAFDTFLSSVSLSGDHKATAKKRREHLMGLLEGELTVLDAITTGSIVHGTAVAGCADLDIVTVLHYGKHIKGESPKAVLETVRDALAGSSKIVKKNGQAVTLYYTKWPNVDIVPASRVKNSDGSVNYYNIPDMKRGIWVRSRPRLHNSTMAELSTRQRQLIQMLKCWNSAHSSIMQSYHLAVLVMSLPDVTSGWPSEVRYFFAEAVKRIDQPLYHPKDTSSQADSYLDRPTRADLKERLRLAQSRAESAESAVNANNHAEAIRLYRVLFGDNFPTYG